MKQLDLVAAVGLIPHHMEVFHRDGLARVPDALALPLKARTLLREMTPNLLGVVGPPDEEDRIIFESFWERVGPYFPAMAKRRANPLPEVVHPLPDYWIERIARMASRAVGAQVGRIEDHHLRSLTFILGVNARDEDVRRLLNWANRDDSLVSVLYVCLPTLRGVGGDPLNEQEGLLVFPDFDVLKAHIPDGLPSTCLNFKDFLRYLLALPAKSTRT